MFITKKKLFKNYLVLIFVKQRSNIKVKRKEEKIKINKNNSRSKCNKQTNHLKLDSF